MERKELIELLNSESYDELEDIIINDRGIDPFLEFIDAYMHEIENYKGYSPIKARKIYEDCINRVDSIFQSYYYYALHLLANNNPADEEKAIETLKKGFSKNPNNETILYLLLKSIGNEEISDFVLADLDINKLDTTDTILSYLVYYCFEKKEKKIIDWLLKLDVLRSYINNDKYETALLIGYLFYINEDELTAREYFSHVVSYANGFVKDYAQLGIVLTSDGEDLERAIKNLPMTYTFDPIVYHIAKETHYVLFEEYLKKLFDVVLSKETVKRNSKLVAKIRGIRGYFKFYSDSSGGLSDLKCAIKQFKNKNYFYALNMIYFYKEKYKEAFKYGIEYLYIASPEERAEGFCSFVIPDNMNEILDLINLVKSSEYKFHNSKKEFFKFVVSPLIEGLYKLKEYNLVCEIVERYDFEHIVKAVGFEVAYSYRECGDNELSKKYYEYLENDKELVSVASLHNLANIYSDERDYENAVKLRQKAFEKSRGEKRYSESLYKEIERQSNYMNMMKEELEAVNSLRDESGWVLRVLNNFYENAENGFIECPYRLLPKFLHLNKIKADEMIQYFIEKKYVRKTSNNEHGIDTQSTVYKVNIEVNNALKEITNCEIIFNELSMFLNDFTPNKLKEFGYDENLLSKVQIISDTNIQDMIIRDLRENIIALITKSFKSSLVISGSIVEALMMHKLKENNIEQHKFEFSGGKDKTIKVENMTLSQLVLVAENYKVFTHEALKHSDAIRGYRNLIHPGVEVRKSADTTIVTEDNALLAWMVTKKVISEM